MREGDIIAVAFCVAMVMEEGGEGETVGWGEQKGAHGNGMNVSLNASVNVWVFNVSNQTNSAETIQSIYGFMC